MHRQFAPRRLDAAGVAAVSVVVSYLVALSMNSLSSGLDSKVITVMEFSKLTKNKQCITERQTLGPPTQLDLQVDRHNSTQ